MATYDMTSSSTTGVGADSVALLPGQNTHHFMYNVEAYLDIDDMVAMLRDGTVALGFDVRTHGVANIQVFAFYGYVHGFS